MNTLSRYDNNVQQDREIPHKDPLVYNFNCSNSIGMERSNTQKPQLKLNNIGKAVLELQQMLQMLQFLKTNSDGFFGQGTMEAVKKFQIIYHLTVDGIVGRKTWEALEKAIKRPRKATHQTLRVGDTNETVIELQNKLKTLGYFHQRATGTFCEETRWAVKQFQENNNLSIDGVVGKKTWQVLDSLFMSSTVLLDRWEKPVSQGVFGEAVKVLQRNLKTIGCYNGEVHGHFGVETAEAVKQFQSKYRVPMTGEVDGNTWQALIETVKKTKTIEADKWEESLPSTPRKTRFTSPRPTLQKGDVGEAVSEIQNLLTKLFYYKGPIDSIFDSITESAVHAFQTNYNLTADGIIGPKTWDVFHSLSTTVTTSSLNSDSQKHTVTQGNSKKVTANKYQTIIHNRKEANAFSSSGDMNHDPLTITPKQIEYSTNQTMNKKRKVSSYDKQEEPYFNYIVQSGDYLRKLANTYETTVEEIEALNHLKSDFLYAGQQLKLPMIPDSL